MKITVSIPCYRSAKTLPYVVEQIKKTVAQRPSYSYQIILVNDCSPDNTFDVVYCNDSFHHYPAPQNVLKEVHRVLKPEGTFLMGDCWQPFVGRVIMNFYMRHSKEGDVKIYSETEIVSMLSEYFHNVSWEQIGNTACIAMAQK